MKVGFFVYTKKKSLEFSGVSNVHSKSNTFAENFTSISLNLTF